MEKEKNPYQIDRVMAIIKGTDKLSSTLMGTDSTKVAIILAISNKMIHIVQKPITIENSL